MIKPGDIISNRYHVLQELGDGNFGRTFEVEDSVMNDHKVIKVLRSSSIPKVLELFEQEYEVLKKLNHPGIPKVQVDGYLKFRCIHTQEILHGLVMEKIAGQDLGEWLKQNQKITNTKLAIEWLKQLIDILDHVHSHNYLHRDIKPDNIMLKPDGQLVLIDFGIVKEATQKNQKQTIPSTKIGTPGYCSPEQDDGRKNVDYKSDFFSLGRTFVHLITGIYPGNGNFQLEPRSSKLLWRHESSEISEEFKDLIDDLIEYQPRERPQNIQEILQELKKIEADNKPTLFPVPIIFLSFALNLVFLTLLAMGNILTLGWKVFFVVVVCVIGGFLFLPLIRYN